MTIKAKMLIKAAFAPHDNFKLLVELYREERDMAVAQPTPSIANVEPSLPIPQAVVEPAKPAKPASSWPEFTKGLDDSDNFVYALSLIGKVLYYEQQGWPFEFKQEYIKAIQATGFKPREHYDVGLVLAESDERLAEYSELLTKELTNQKAKVLYEGFATELGLPKDELSTPETHENSAKRFLALNRAANNVNSKALSDAIKLDISNFSNGLVAREAAIAYLESIAPGLDICWKVGAVVKQLEDARNSPTAINFNYESDWLTKLVWLDLVKPGLVSEDDYLALISFRKSFLTEFNSTVEIDTLYGIAYLLTCCKQTKPVKDYAKKLLKDHAKPVDEEQLAEWATGNSQDVYDYLYMFDGVFDKYLPDKSDYDSVVQGV